MVQLPGLVVLLLLRSHRASQGFKHVATQPFSNHRFGSSSDFREACVVSLRINEFVLFNMRFRYIKAPISVLTEMENSPVGSG